MNIKVKRILTAITKQSDDSYLQCVSVKLAGIFDKSKWLLMNHEKMSQSKWEIKYNTLYKNRKIGKIGENTFEDFMSGYNPDFGIEAGQGTRYIDNIKPNTKTAREIKTGKVKLTTSIKKQIDNDIDIIVNELSSKVRKVEWHFLDGADDKVKEYIADKIKKNKLDPDVIKYIEY